MKSWWPLLVIPWLGLSCGKVPLVDLGAEFTLADASWFQAEETLFAFYAERIPEGIYNGRGFDKWRKDAERDGARPGIEPGSLEDWLKRKGIKSSVSPIEGEVSAALLALATGSGASMIVAGAYGHSRIGERLFGGTSRRLLNADEAPALALAR